MNLYQNLGKADMFDWTEWSENSEAELNYLDEAAI